MDNQKLTHLRVEPDTRKPTAYFFFFFLPFLSMLLFFLIVQKNPMDFHLVFSDELDYWAETATLIKRGLFSPNAGYFGYSFGNFAPLSYFGAHGFFSLIPSALIGFFAPRSQVTVLALNSLFMGISLSTAYYLIGSFRKLLVIALSLFVFYPFYLYYQTGMIETLFYAGSIILAVLCVRCFTPGPRQQSFLRLYFWIVILFSLFRLSNLALLIPAFFVEIRLNKRGFLPVLLKYGVLTVGVALVSILTAATYPWGFLSKLGRSTEKLSLIVAHTVANINLYFGESASNELEVWPRLLFLSWLIFLCFYSVFSKVLITKKTDYFLLSQILTMTAILFINLIFYDLGIFRDLRVFSPILVFSMIVCSLSDRGRIFIKIVFFLAVIFLLVSNYVVIIECNLAWDLFVARRYEEVHPPAILQSVRYNPDAKTRWENTAYVELAAYGQLDWQNYDPGIGFMVLGLEDIESLKSANPGSLLNAKYVISSHQGQLAGYDLISEISNLSLYIKAD